MMTRGALAFLAISAAAATPAHAAVIDGKSIRKNSITGKQIKKGSVEGSDLKGGTIEARHLAPSLTQALAGLAGRPGPTGPTGPAGSGGASYTAGTGLSLNVLEFSLDTAFAQRRVGSECAAGSAIRAIAQDGTVTCEADDFGAPGAGDVSAVNTTAGSGLTGGAAGGDITLNTDLSILQKRVSTACAAGQAITAVAQTGAPTCAAFGDITGVTAGTGLTGGGTSGTPTLGITVPLSLTSDAGFKVAHFVHPDSGIGVSGESGDNIGVHGGSSGVTGRAVYGVASGATGVGVDGYATGLNGTAIRGYAQGAGGVGIRATSGGKAGVFEGDVEVAGNAAITAPNLDANDALTLIAAGTNSNALYAVAQGAGSYAGSFTGNVNVGGVLTKNSGAFRIDHPLDPANKYLQHSFVESPEMKNIYDGVVRTDRRGFATVRMPDWFDALNRDFRYQLTVMGRSFARAIVWQELRGRRFVIRTSQPGVKVSWQVTGIREDVFAKANPIRTEVAKTSREKGRYMHPELFGKPLSLRIGDR